MTHARECREGRQPGTGSARKDRGYSLIEVIFAVVVILILAAFAVPQMGAVIYQYRLQGAVASATWAVQSTRYQALMAGYPYQVVFKKATSNYQIQDLPPGAGAYANVGTAVPLSGATIALNQDTTFRFLPNGSVSAPTGALNNFTITYHGSTKTISVSTYGNVKVSP